MPRLLFNLALLISVVLTATSLAARLLGSTQPPYPALRGFTESCEGKSQPCWYGIVPEKTIFDDAVRLLNNRKFSVEISPRDWEYVDAAIKAGYLDCDVWLFRSAADTNLLDILSFQNCRTLKLGDILNQFGTPYTVGTTLSCHFNPREHGVPMANYWMHYPKIGSLRLNAKPDYWAWLSPNDSVISFDVFNLIGDFPPPKKWEGFIPFWRYFRLHIDQVQTSSCGP